MPQKKKKQGHGMMKDIGKYLLNEGVNYGANALKTKISGMGLRSNHRRLLNHNNPLAFEPIKVNAHGRTLGGALINAGY